MNLLRYYISLLEPVVIKTDGADPNTTTTSSFIPGSVIRGALIACFSKRQKNGISTSDPIVRRLFFSHQTCFLNAYPVVRGDRQRSLPLPLSFAQRKHDGEQEALDLIVSNTVNSEDIRPCTPGFGVLSVGGEEDFLTPVQPLMSISVHTARPRAVGSPDKQSGAVFHQESLHHGQHFAGVILAAEEADLRLLSDLLSDLSYVGSSKGGGYGKIEVDPARFSFEEATHEFEGASRPVSGGQLVMTLTSHANLRLNSGMTVSKVQDMQSYLSELLDEPVNVDTGSAFARLELTGGFNRKWRLPLPKEHSLLPGSVFILSSPSADAMRRLQQLAIAGIGERRTEGFGRFCINLHGEVASYRILPSSQTGPTRFEISEDSPARPTAQMIVDRIAKTAIDRELRRLVRRTQVDNVRAASNSQINGLRNVVEDLLNKPVDGSSSACRLSEYLTSVESRDASRQQLDKVKVDNQPFAEWLQSQCNLIEKPEGNHLWNKMNITADNLVSIGGVRPDLRDTASSECRLRFIHAILLKLAR